MAWGREGLQINSVALPADVGCSVPPLPPSHTPLLAVPQAFRKVSALSHLVETEGLQP